VPRILVLNSNTTASVTDLVVRHARAVDPTIEWVPATARFGAPYISTEATYAIGAHAALDAFEAFGAGCDAVLLACFGDPGLFALKEVSPVPVVGLAEASLIVAQRTAPRFSIVTGGERWKPMLERFAAGLGYRDALASVRPITLTGDRIAADPDGALDALAEACRQAAEADGAGAIILGGAALAGLGERVQPRLDVPVLDSVVVAARHVADLTHRSIDRK
jgi:Asp/Glu/hydantoin racemase